MNYALEAVATGLMRRWIHKGYGSPIRTFKRHEGANRATRRAAPFAWLESRSKHAGGYTPPNMREVAAKAKQARKRKAADQRRNRRVH